MRAQITKYNYMNIIKMTCRKYWQIDKLTNSIFWSDMTHTAHQEMLGHDLWHV